MTTLKADKTIVEINQTVTLDASASTDDGRIDYYFLDFGGQSKTFEEKS